jgi:voltage-gated potassium channel
MVDARVPRYLRKYWRWKYATLLSALLLVYLLLPFLGYRSSQVPTFRLGLLGVMLFCVLATARNSYIMGLVTAMAVAGEVTLLFWPPGRGYFQVVFFCIASGVVLHDVMTGDGVSSDKILGAVCGYLLIGMVFAFFYNALEEAQVLAFQTDDPGFHTFLYFSLVTLTTLGYGDIVPITAQAKALTSMEAVIGQFYLAVVVARLVSLHLFESQKIEEGNGRDRVDS